MPKSTTLSLYQLTNNIPSDSTTDHIPNAKQRKSNQDRSQPTTATSATIQEHPQQLDTFPTHNTILTITEGSNTDIDTKRQQRDDYRQVNHVAVKGPVTQTKWSHMPITFLAKDVNLASFPRTKAMVITIHNDR
jgi:hypothetical protein